MRVLVFKGSYDVIRKSGIGRAIDNQIEALRKNNVDYTEDTEEYYDIVHLNTVFPNSVIMALRAKLHGKKIVYYGHSTMEDFKRSFTGSNLIAPLFKQWLKFCYSLGDLIITPTDYSKRILMGYGLKKTIVVLSNGIDLKEYTVKETYAYEFRKTYNIQANEKVIIGVGHYIERKGILDFVEMAKKLPQYKFIWFGYTDPKLIPSTIKNALKVELPNLIFAGYVEKNQLKKAYAGADLFWFPTWEETEGIVLLEAMATGIPVLVRDIEIYREWLPENVVVHKAKDIDGFEDKIKEFFAGSLPDLTDAAYELVCNNDIEAIGNKLYLLYKQYFTSLFRNSSYLFYKQIARVRD